MSELYSYQERFRELMLDGRSIILQAPTGSGKTRAALTPFLDTFWDAPSSIFPKKCVYVVPMRVLANQFTEETRQKAERYERIHKRQLKVGRQTGEYREDPEFREKLTFATIDQVLSSWLMSPYSLPRRLGNLNAGAFVGSYLVFDEFHLFDPDSTLPTTLHMLKTLKDISPFVLMTATFSKEMLEKLAGHLNAVAFLLTDEMLGEIPAQKKERRYTTMASPLTYKDEDKQVQAEATAVSHILQTHQTRTLVVCNQVERAQAVYRALCEAKPEGVIVRLLHSRFLQADRQALEAMIRQEFHKDKAQHTIASLILVATQVVEVGLDMSCTALHTDLAPAASILQRAGRCARYEGEVGQVYVYPLADDGYAPYHCKLARQQADLGWAWLQDNQNRHLTFADEQALINHAHTASDNLILKAVFETEFEWKSQIQAAWRGEKNRGETAVLIRNIPSVSVVIHPDPDQLTGAPFKADSFSLHPSTLQGKFKEWQEANDALDPDSDAGHLDWLVKKLVEDEDDEDMQGNRPIRYGFKKVASKYELHAPLLALNPALVGYSKELGLTLYPGESYQCAVPQTAVAQHHTAYRYQLESYSRHIELVHRAFVTNSLPLFQAAAKRLEAAYGWQTGIITEMAHLVMAVHDVGKLSVGWQTWAHEWQAAIGNEITEPHYAAAHTDYDPTNSEHQQKNQKMRGKRPSHAVESALAALPILQSLVAFDMPTYQPLLRAAFTAVARHHAPFSSQTSNYQLVSYHLQHIESTLPIFAKSIQNLNHSVVVFPEIDLKQFSTDRLDKTLFVDVRDETSICCYMLLVRALRTADQKGTSLGTA